jgi:hypothetical protein
VSAVRFVECVTPWSRRQVTRHFALALLALSCSVDQFADGEESKIWVELDRDGRWVEVSS